MGHGNGVHVGRPIISLLKVFVVHNHPSMDRSCVLCYTSTIYWCSAYN